MVISIPGLARRSTSGPSRQVDVRKWKKGGPGRASLLFPGRRFVEEERAMRPPEKPASRVLWVVPPT
jgi:hypothetical protein